MRRALPLVTVVVVASAAAVYAAARPTAGRGLVTAAVGRGDVTPTLELTGTVTSARQQVLRFPVTGPVTSVAVGVGSRVSTGQELARLDPAALQSAVLDAAAALAQAQAAAAADTADAAAAAATAATGAATTTARPAPTPTARGAATSAGRVNAVGVNTTATELARATADVTRALAQALALCLGGPATAAPTADPSPAAPTAAAPADPSPAVPTAAPSTTAPPSGGRRSHGAAVPPGGVPGPAATAAGSCADALAQASAAQRAVTTDQAALLTSLGTGASQAGTTTPVARPVPRPSAAQQTPGPTSRAGTGQGPPSPSRLITDRAAVASAQVLLGDAQTALAGATLRAPFAGTVAAVSLVAGGSANAGGITLVAPGAVTVSVAVPLASVRSVRLGMPAAVTADGGTTSSSGVVESLGLLPVPTTTSSTPAYPAVVLVPNPGPGLASGARAQVSLNLGTVHGAVTVPDSALAHLGPGTALATVVTARATRRVLVRTGAVGATTTEVLGGLSPGQHVELADPSQPVPANSTVVTRRFTGGGPPGRGGRASAGG